MNRTPAKVLLEGQQESAKKIQDELHESSERGVAILGSFDTWPLMDYCARYVAKHNPDSIAITSRFIYQYDSNSDKVVLDQHTFPVDESMHDFLDRIVRNLSSCAVICYSTPAAHYIETDWCYKLGKPTLGIFFCRTPAWINEISQRCPIIPSGKDQNDCQFLTSVPPAEEVAEIKYSYCTPRTQNEKGSPAERWKSVWCCMKSSEYCPFIAQGTSKNVLEYYLLSEKMVAAAISRIEAIDDILGTVMPNTGTFIFPWDQ